VKYVAEVTFTGSYKVIVQTNKAFARCAETEVEEKAIGFLSEKLTECNLQLACVDDVHLEKVSD